MDSYGDSTALAAAYLIAALTWFIFAVVFYVLGSLFLMKIFEGRRRRQVARVGAVLQRDDLPEAR